MRDSMPVAIFVLPNRDGACSGRPRQSARPHFVVFHPKIRQPGLPRGRFNGPCLNCVKNEELCLLEAMADHVSPGRFRARLNVPGTPAAISYWYEVGEAKSPVAALEIAVQHWRLDAHVPIESANVAYV